METLTTSQNNLPVIGHLEELRKRIIYILVFLALGIVVGLFLAKYLIHLLEIPIIQPNQPLNFILLNPTDVVNIYFKIALYIGAVISSPAIIFHIWQYVKPAVPKDASVSIRSWVVCVVLLFCAGTVFFWKYLLPPAYKFLMGLSAEIANPTITLNSYISFALSIIIIGGLIFEMPVIAALLTRMRIITPGLLTAKWREVVFALCVIAAVVTPTTDVFNMILFVLPMIALFGVSILVSSVVYKIYIKGPSGGDYAD
jgi:sec-independent protein translocase protein TatC